MIKAEYNKMHGVEVIIDCHCIPELKIELLSILTAFYKNAPEVALDVIEDYVNFLKENREHDS